LLTAAASAGVLSQPIGACRMGQRMFNLSVRTLLGHIWDPLKAKHHTAEASRRDRQVQLRP
jgi:hypothetical protein